MSVSAQQYFLLQSGVFIGMALVMAAGAMALSSWTTVPIWMIILGGEIGFVVYWLAAGAGGLYLADVADWERAFFAVTDLGCALFFMVLAIGSYRRRARL